MATCEIRILTANNTEGAMGDDTNELNGDEPTTAADGWGGIAGEPLLTADEEVDLAKAIEAGLLAEQLLGSGRELTVEQRSEYEELVRRGRAAKERMIEANLRLVLHMAKRYPWVDADFRRELIQEGSIGLVRAVEKFDYRRGYRFSTMATWWIRHGFTCAWSSARGIRLPEQVGQQTRKVRRIRAELSDVLHRAPSEQEIAAKAGMSPERVAELLVVGLPEVSLQTPVGEGGAELGHVVVDESAPDLIDALAARDMARTLCEVVETLPQDQAKVIRIRFGIGGGRPASLAEAAQVLGMREAVVRQREAKGLASLRHPSRARQLQDFAA